MSKKQDFFVLGENNLFYKDWINIVGNYCVDYGAVDRYEKLVDVCNGAKTNNFIVEFTSPLAIDIDRELFYLINSTHGFNFYFPVYEGVQEMRREVYTTEFPTDMYMYFGEDLQNLLQKLKVDGCIVNRKRTGIYVERNVMMPIHDILPL